MILYEMNAAWEARFQKQVRHPQSLSRNWRMNSSRYARSRSVTATSAAMR